MKLKRHKQFLKDWHKVRLTDGQFEKFISYANHLRTDKPLSKVAKDHSLNGEYDDYREFHLGGDVLVIYKIITEELTFYRIGSHSQLFK